MLGRKKPKKIKFPNGETKEPPEDGYRSYGGDRFWQWDGFLEKWFDNDGNGWVDPNPLDLPRNTKGCECGAWVSGEYVKHSDYCKLYTPDQFREVPFDEFKKDKK